MQNILYAACAAAVIALAFLAYARRMAGAAVLETVRLTPDGDALRVVQISDVHIKIKAVPVSKIISLVQKAAPHILIFTGDYIQTEREADRFVRWMERLVNAAGGAAFYLCFGNHDNYAFESCPTLARDFTKRLKALGVYIMEDRTLSYARAGKIYDITGFSDYHSARSFNIQKALRGASKDAAYHIGFSHNPDIAFALNGPRPDLLLLGHFHGGQIWLPFHLEYICLRKERMCRTGFYRGLRDFNGRLVYISRGVGCVMFPLRFGSRPEITLFLIPESRQ